MSAISAGAAPLQQGALGVCMLRAGVIPCMMPLRRGAEAARWAHNPEVVGSSPTARNQSPRARRTARRAILCALACLWPLCHPVPASAAPCTIATAVTSPCEGVLVPVADLLACATDKADLAACMAHRERERQSCERQRAIAAEAAEVREWTLRRERDAARARADAMSPDDSGPSWWTVVGVGAVGVAVGVVVGVLVSGQ